MSRPTDILHPPALERFSWARFGLWTLAGIVMVSVHVGGAVWALRPQPVEPVSEAAPAAIMIELAAETVAPQTQEEEIAPQDEESDQATASPPAETVEEPVEEIEPKEPEAVAEPDPVRDPVDEPVEEPEEIEPEEIVEEPVEQPEPPEEVDEPVEEVTAPMFENVEFPVPTRRPSYTPKKAETPKPKTASTPQPQSTSSNASAKAKVRAKEAPRAAARQSSRGFTSSLTPARWQSRLMAHLERRKRYPSGARKRREEGVVYVRFRIDPNGTVLSVSLARSSGHTELDREVVDLVRRASPVPAPPPGVNHTITAPVRFSLR